jgi:hypothetical protein
LIVVSKPFLRLKPTEILLFKNKNKKPQKSIKLFFLFFKPSRFFRSSFIIASLSVTTSLPKHQTTLKKAEENNPEVD